MDAVDADPRTCLLRPPSACTGSALPFASTGSASLYSIARSVARYACSPTRIPFTGAADWSRAAVLTTSPAAIVSPASGRASTVTSASPVLTPIRTSMPSSVAHSRIAKRRTDRALRIVLVRDRRAEDRHRRVADELLHGAAVAFELRTYAGVVAAELGGDVLRVELLRARGETDQIGEQDRDDLPLPAGLNHAVESRHP